MEYFYSLERIKEDLSLMKNLFEYSDILHSPIEAFTCATENVHLPVEAHWHYFMEVIYLQEGSVLVTCNDACKRVEAGSVMFFPPQAVHAIYADGGKGSAISASSST